jgi:hypothetical protein
MHAPRFNFPAVVVVVIAVAAGSAAALGGNQHDDTETEAPVQLGTELVTVAINVSDKKNPLVADVTRDEIQVFEDGKQQAIFSFGARSRS